MLPQLPPEAYVTDWTRSFVNFFHAVEITKRLMFVILVVIVLVAAINVVSTLVVMVSGKQGDIAILRTMGASRAAVSASSSCTAWCWGSPAPWPGSPPAR